MLKRIFLGVAFLIVLLIGALHISASYIVGDENSVEEYFGSLNLSYTSGIADVKNEKLHWVGTPKDSLSQLILFLHGTPGSWKDFSAFLSDSLLRNQYNMIAVDRPGHGLSMYDKSVISIEEQADIIGMFLQDVKCDSLVLVGYSYGGPIASILASQFSTELPPT